MTPIEWLVLAAIVVAHFVREFFHRRRKGH
jgi:hypothetical protein